jgi:hypothetical protein
MKFKTIAITLSKRIANFLSSYRATAFGVRGVLGVRAVRCCANFGSKVRESLGSNAKVKKTNNKQKKKKK